MADGDCYKVTLEWRYSTIDVAVQNVIWFRQEGEEVAPNIPEQILGARLATAMPGGSSWSSLFRAWLDTGFSILNVRVQKVWPAVAGAYVTPVNVGGQGAGGPTYIPSSAAILVRLRSTLNSRRGRGRIYLGGIASAKTQGGTEYAMANNGYWGANVRASAGAFISDLELSAQAPVAGEAIYRMGVWSKTVAGPSPPYQMAFSPLADWEVTSAIRVQRRREVGVGI